MSVINLIIAGVGGQGNVIASQIVGMAAVLEGWRVAAADTFGVSQRGGAVMSHLRLARGDTGCGPLISSGEAEIVVGLEPLETVRVLKKYGNRSTRVIVNTRPSYPLSVLSGTAKYPAIAVLLEAIAKHSQVMVEVRADRLAREAGNLLTQNVVMAGALAGSGWLPYSMASFERVLQALFRERGHLLDSNLLAFRLGAETVSQSLGSTAPARTQRLATASGA